MREFQLIRQIQRQTSASSEADSGVMLGIGDDAAVLEVPVGQHLVAATDTLNAGVHFPKTTSPFDIAYKSLAVNLSDMAAMGAEPRWVLLSLTSPEIDPLWARSFFEGFNALAQTHDVSLVGGDTTSGPLSINITAMGLIKAGAQLTRSGANPGDLIVVSGTLGGAARVLDILYWGDTVTERHLLDRPQPRVDLGQALVGYASACIDISDGLLADLNHILQASSCGARLQIASLPKPENLLGLDNAQIFNYQLTGGDDYELLFTIPPRLQPRLVNWASQLDINLSVIGKIETQDGIRCIKADGGIYEPRGSGFEHFSHQP